jgi:hypothetical protein
MFCVNHTFNEGGLRWIKAKKKIFFMARHGIPGTNPTERWSDGVLALPITPSLHHSITDQFTHLCNPAPKSLFFNRVIRLFSIFLRKFVTSASPPTIYAKNTSFQSSPVKPSRT